MNFCVLSCTHETIIGYNPGYVKGFKHQFGLLRTLLTISYCHGTIITVNTIVALISNGMTATIYGGNAFDVRGANGLNH